MNLKAEDDLSHARFRASAFGRLLPYVSLPTAVCYCFRTSRSLHVMCRCQTCGPRSTPAAHTVPPTRRRMATVDRCPLSHFPPPHSWRTSLHVHEVKSASLGLQVPFACLLQSTIAACLLHETTYRLHCRCQPVTVRHIHICRLKVVVSLFTIAADCKDQPHAGRPPPRRGGREGWGGGSGRGREAQGRSGPQQGREEVIHSRVAIELVHKDSVWNSVSWDLQWGFCLFG